MAVGALGPYTLWSSLSDRPTRKLWLASLPLCSRPFVLKHYQWAHQSEFWSEDKQTRPHFETLYARRDIYTSFRHPAVLPLLQIEASQDQGYLVMPPACGALLAHIWEYESIQKEVLQIGAIPTTTVASTRWIYQLLSGLSALEEALGGEGFCHGDINPWSLYTSTTGPQLLWSHHTDERKCQDYRAPEGAAPSVATDLFSIGVLWFRWLTGTLPRKEPGSGAIHPRSWADIRKSVAPVLQRFLAPTPEGRYRHFGEASEAVFGLLLEWKEEVSSRDEVLAQLREWLLHGQLEQVLARLYQRPSLLSDEAVSGYVWQHVKKQLGEGQAGAGEAFYRLPSAAQELMATAVDPGLSLELRGEAIERLHLHPTDPVVETLLDLLNEPTPKLPLLALDALLRMPRQRLPRIACDDSGALVACTHPWEELTPLTPEGESPELRFCGACQRQVASLLEIEALRAQSMGQCAFFSPQQLAEHRVQIKVGHRFWLLCEGEELRMGEGPDCAISPRLLPHFEAVRERLQLPFAVALLRHGIRASCEGEQATLSVTEVGAVALARLHLFYHPAHQVLEISTFGALPPRMSGRLRPSFALGPPSEEPA